MTVPALSVIIPVYNGEEYLDECLACVTGQTLSNIEIICVDDGSRDNSLNILTAWAQKDSRIVAVRQNHSGVSAARNAGLKVSRAPLIAFVDMDDTLAPCAYEQAVEKMTPDVDWVCFGIVVVRCVNKAKIVQQEDYYRIKYKGKFFPTEEILLNMDYSPCNKIFRKSILENRQISFPVSLHYEDAYFCALYGLFCRAIFFMDEELYFYLRHEGSVMDRTFHKQPMLSQDHLYIAFAVYRYLKEINLFWRYKHYFGEFFFYCVNFALLHSAGAQLNNVYSEACDFLTKENISFSEFPRLNHKRKMLEKRVWNSKVKSCFGLICRYYSADSYKISFLGIPLIKKKYID